MYGLYNRTNVDGSKSESVAQLALGVAYNTGREIDLEPGVSLQLKVQGLARTTSLMATQLLPHPIGRGTLTL